MAGFIGNFEFGANDSVSVLFYGCQFSGSVLSNGKNVSSDAGGFIGSSKSQIDEAQFEAKFGSCVNYGSVKSTGNASGFIINSNLDHSIVQNCVQKGTIDAPKMFSISLHDLNVHNFATTTGAALWGISLSTKSEMTNVFGAGTACGDLDSCQVLLKEEGNNVFYYVMQGDKKVRVDGIMNTYGSRKNSYFWSSKLDLTDLFVVTVYQKNSVLTREKMQSGGKLGSIEVLRSCFGSENCSVTDMFDGSECTANTEVHMDYVLSFVIKDTDPGVLVSFETVIVDISSVNKTEVAQIIASVCGIESGHVVVTDISFDENKNTYVVTVLVANADEAESVIVSVSTNQYQDSNIDVLSNAQNAHIVVEKSSSSMSSSAKSSSVKSSGVNPSVRSLSSAHRFNFIEAVNILCFFFLLSALNMII